MRTKLWIPLLFLMTANTASAFSVRWVCATEPLSTSYSLIENDSNFELQFVHHNGLAFLPVHDGLITAFDLPEIERKTKIFSRLGERGSIFFEKSQCSSVGREWTCTKEGDLKVGDLETKNLQVTIRERRVITRRVDYKSYTLDLSFRVGGEGLRVPMEYHESACTFHDADKGTQP